jgi:hypothetical protein
MLKHVRWHSPERRVLIDSHDLRLGLFYTRARENFPGSAWLHLPGVVIDLSPASAAHATGADRTRE